MWRVASFVAVLGLSAACGPKTSGLGGGSGAKPGTGSSSGSVPTDGSTESGGTDNDTTGGTSGPESGGTTIGPSEGTTTATTTPVDPCDPPPLVVHEIDLSTASLDANMSQNTLPRLGSYAYSEAEDLGSVSFGFDVECEDEFLVWAQVHDPEAGFDDLGTLGDPDSYLVGFDAETSTHWWYGCQMLGANPMGGAAWSWLSVRDNQFCITSEFRETLEPGPHRFRVINREPGVHLVSGSDIGFVAAISRVIVTNDPAYTP